MQEDAGAFFIRFCAINPISGSKKNGFFQSGGHGASIPRRRHRRDSVYLEGYGGDNPGAKSQGAKQFVAGAGVALIGTTLIPLLTGLFGG